MAAPMHLTDVPTCSPVSRILTGLSSGNSSFIGLAHQALIFDHAAPFSCAFQLLGDLAPLASGFALRTRVNAVPAACRAQLWPIPRMA
jgi:hypothetical protein